MKPVLSFCCLVIFAISSMAQSGNTSKLSGIVYDAQGSVIVGANVTATDKDGNRFATKSNGSGEYELALPYNKYDPKLSLKFREAKYDIVAKKDGFKESVTKGFVFISSQFGGMRMDIALEISTGHEPCGYGGADC